MSALTWVMAWVPASALASALASVPVLAQETEQGAALGVCVGSALAGRDGNVSYPGAGQVEGPHGGHPLPGETFRRMSPIIMECGVLWGR